MSVVGFTGKVLLSSLIFFFLQNLQNYKSWISNQPLILFKTTVDNLSLTKTVILSKLSESNN